MENYGFCLGKNRFDNLKLRVVVGTAPEGKVENPAELLPTAKMLSEPENLDKTTELLKIKPHKVSTDLLNYLRSVLLNNFTEDEDFKLIHVSTPRVVKFELMIIDFASKLLESYGKTILFKRTSLEQDAQTLPKSHEHQTILQYNMGQKQIFASHMKFLEVLRAVLRQF